MWVRSQFHVVIHANCYLIVHAHHSIGLSKQSFWRKATNITAHRAEAAEAERDDITSTDSRNLIQNVLDFVNWIGPRTSLINGHQP
jgi:hypothetical protein